jgi:hypothetical protein
MIAIERKKLEQVLDDLICASSYCNTYDAIDVVKEALAQPEQEPVAFYNPQHGGFYWAKPTTIYAPQAVDIVPLALYTTPPAAQTSHDTQRKPLSDHKIAQILDHERMKWNKSPPTYEFDLAFARAIEAALKEKTFD